MQRESANLSSVILRWYLDEFHLIQQGDVTQSFQVWCQWPTSLGFSDIHLGQGESVGLQCSIHSLLQCLKNTTSGHIQVSCEPLNPTSRDRTHQNEGLEGEQSLGNHHGTSLTTSVNAELSLLSEREVRGRHHSV